LASSQDIIKFQILLGRASLSMQLQNISQNSMFLSPTILANNHCGQRPMET